MRISDWSSAVCSSDLPIYRLGLRGRRPHLRVGPLSGPDIAGAGIPPPDRAAGAAPIVITGTMGAADRMSRSFRWPSACRGTVLLPLDMQAMLAPGDEQAARQDPRRADPRRLGGDGGEKEPAASDRPEQASTEARREGKAGGR